MEASSTLYFWTPIQTHRSTRHCICIFIVANPVLMPEVYRSSESGSAQLKTLPISTVNRSQHLNNAD